MENFTFIDLLQRPLLPYSLFVADGTETGWSRLLDNWKLLQRSSVYCVVDNDRQWAWTASLQILASNKTMSRGTKILALFRNFVYCRRVNDTWKYLDRSLTFVISMETFHWILCTILLSQYAKLSHISTDVSWHISVSVTYSATLQDHSQLKRRFLLYASRFSIYDEWRVNPKGFSR
jgi:hypothetical protein